MLRNYLLTAWRAMRRQRLYTAINLGGLTLGIAAFLCIYLYVRDELTYDQHHQQAPQLYRIHFQGAMGNQAFHVPQVAAPTAAALVQDYPEVLNAARLRTLGPQTIQVDETHSYKEKDAAFADNSLFELFTIPVVAGSATEALTAPHTAALSLSAAEKYYGPGNAAQAVGQTINIGETPYLINAVFEDMPGPSHFHFKLLMSMASLPESKQPIWTSNNFYTYVLLKAGASRAALEAQFPAMLKKYMGPEIEKFMGVDFDQFMAAGNHAHYYLMPLTDIHLASDTKNEIERNGSMQYVTIFSLIGLFIIGLACINFMNMATARSAGRAKEVGVRKVMGAVRHQLVRQFLAEALLLTTVAAVLALLMVYFALPWFNVLTNKAIGTEALVAPATLAVLATVLVVTGLAAGSYPAFFLSSFRPVKVLKGTFAVGHKGTWLRNALVVFQFAITITLIIGTLVVFQQLQYIQNKNLGFNKSQVLILNDAYNLGNNLQPFKAHMLAQPGVTAATVSSFLPVPSAYNQTTYFEGQQPGKDNTLMVNSWEVDEAYVPTMGMQLAAGTGFSGNSRQDSATCLVNQTLVKAFGWANPLGRKISHFGSAQSKSVYSYTVVGVVKDFHYETMRNSISPLVMLPGTSSSYLCLRTNAADIPALVATMEQQWAQLAGGQPFNYTFLDQAFAKMYTAEQRVGQLALVASVLSVVIACLGLLGLAAFMAEQRTKEIGIRRVLGATVGQMVLMLSRKTLLLVAMAFVPAAPLAWYLMQQWLQGFQYRIVPGWWVFAAAGCGALLLAWATMGWQAFRAARTNPARTLRDE